MTNRLGNHWIGGRVGDVRRSVTFLRVSDPEAPLSRTGVWITRLILLLVVAAVVIAVLIVT